MLRLLPGTELTVRAGYESDPDDLPGRLTVHRDTPEAMRADELAVVLDADAEITRADTPRRTGTLVLTARPDAAELGFGAGGRGLLRWRLSSASTTDGGWLWRALNRWPDGHVELSAIADDDASFRMSLSLMSDAVAPIALCVRCCVMHCRASRLSRLIRPIRGCDATAPRFGGHCAPSCRLAGRCRQASGWAHPPVCPSR